MKFIAFYLPQFHQIPENNLRRGEGFTDRKNVIKAKPLYMGHKQPNIPLNSKYYDLSNKDSLLEQVNILSKYGIYGLCIYHYRFNGKKLLETPANIILSNLDITTNFCFSWANEPWTRSRDGKNRDILMPQAYGDKQDWDDHFEYLKDFFLDGRYIKINNSPVLVIYRTNNIPNLDEMLLYRDIKCRTIGFAGIHIIETLNGFQQAPVSDFSKGFVEFEPMYTLRYHSSFWHKLYKGLILFARRFGIKTSCMITKIQYKELWNKIIWKERKDDFQKTRYLGGFVGRDNTPRKGFNGTVVEGKNLSDFEIGICNQIQQSKSEFIFINARNEWAEGAYLEPDTAFRFGFLEILKKYSNYNK